MLQPDSDPVADDAFRSPAMQHRNMGCPPAPRGSWRKSHCEPKRIELLFTQIDRHGYNSLKHHRVGRPVVWRWPALWTFVVVGNLALGQIQMMAIRFTANGRDSRRWFPEAPPGSTVSVRATASHRQPVNREEEPVVAVQLWSSRRDTRGTAERLGSSGAGSRRNDAVATRADVLPAQRDDTRQQGEGFPLPRPDVVVGGMRSYPSDRI
jgi:hypothetical protein